MDRQPSVQDADNFRFSFKKDVAAESQRTAQNDRLSNRGYVLRLMRAHKGELSDMTPEMTADLADVVRYIHHNQK